MTNFDAERHTAEEFAEMQQVFDEEDFLKMVRRCKSIGYGRMMQIVSFEWHEHDDIGALALGTTVGMLSEKDQRQYKAVKAIDPLF